MVDGFGSDKLGADEVYAQAIRNCAARMEGETPLHAAEALQDELARLKRATERGAVRPRHVLVIGGAGYVGSVMVRDLLKRGYRTRVLDNFLYSNSLSLEGLYDEPGFSLVMGDLRDPDVLDRAMDGVTDVVLLASLVGDPISKKFPDLTRSVNQAGSETVFRAMQGRGIHKFVFTSTCSNYGLREDNSPADETSELRPLSIYAETKVGFEKFILNNLDEADFTPTILRISTAFGLSHRMRFDLTVNEFTAALARGESLDVFDKDTWRPYCHVRDIARAVIRVLEAPEEKVRGEVFNVGSDDNNYTKAMIIDEILKHTKGDVHYVEKGSDPRNYRVNFAKIRNVLGFETKYSVAAFVPELIQAVHSGLYLRSSEIPGFYGNYDVRAEAAAA
ncbi:MAG: NAD(P)-dependent oxidoreductase [Parvibaculum sp.]